MTAVLVVNSGSSSLKYQLVDVDAAEALATGLVERIGQPEGRATHTDGAGAEFREELAIPDHDAAFTWMLRAFAERGPSLDDHAPVAVGHRVVQGGARFFEPSQAERRAAEGCQHGAPEPVRSIGKNRLLRLLEQAEGAPEVAARVGEMSGFEAQGAGPEQRIDG